MTEKEQDLADLQLTLIIIWYKAFGSKMNNISS